MRPLGLLILTGGLLTAGEPTAKPSERADALDLLVLGDKTQRVELRVEIGGKSVQAVWDDTFVKLHVYFDRDGNGSLDEAEAMRLPAAFALRQVLWGQFAPDARATVPFADLDLNNDGKVGRDETADYYRRAGLGGVLVGVGKTPATDRLTDALLQHLDTDKDGKVGEAEWKAAAAALRKLDRNDDDLIGPGELVEKTAYPAATGAILMSAPNPTVENDSISDSLPFLVLPLRTADAHWQAALTARREREKKPAVSAAALRREKPAAVWSVKLNEKLADDARRVHTVDDIRIELRLDAGRLVEHTAAARKRLAAMFAECDPNADEVLDGKELDNPKAGPFKQLLAIADRDGDGKLSDKEFGEWFDLQEQVAKGHVLLTVIDHGRGLFEFLDADHDGSVSVRELRAARGRLSAAGCATETGIDRTRLPRQLLAAVSHGQPLSAIGKPARTGPAWFLAMDRNGDGDVSAKEWVGDLDVFRTLDADDDGLLSSAEAERAAPKK